MVKLGKNLESVIILLFILIMLEGGSAILSLSSLSVPTHYQGAKAQFDETYSGMGFDTTLHFDPDERDIGMCNLEGEMTSVFVPAESLSNMPDWIPTDWISSASYIQNPRESYEWESGNFTYTMEAWTLRWYVSISANWDSCSYPKILGLSNTQCEYFNKRYGDTEIWFEFDLTPTWYFEPVREDVAYFAIAKMQLSDNADLTALDNSGELVEPELTTSIAPESRASILPIYYGLFAEENPADKETSDYQGKQLNPDLFTSKVYTYIRLVNFGTTRWTEHGVALWPVERYKGDVVTFAVDVTVFVIGEWTVQDIEELDEYEEYGRNAQFGYGGWSWETFLSSPANRFLLVLIAGVAVFLILAILFPSVIMGLSLLLQALTGGKRRR
jgi:hypothetical protein